jgi:UDP-N-acetylglucosamine 3-dehydrogenase
MSIDPPVRFVVIGCGAMGKNHARVLSDLAGVELVGVVDANPHVADALAYKYRCFSFESIEDMLRDPDCCPDAAVVALPTSAHFAATMELLDANLHVLVEKPIAFDHGDGILMIAEANRRNLILGVGHVERFNPAVQQAADRVMAGELGRVFQIDARRQGPFPSRISDVGVVVDLAVHDLDAMRFVLGRDLLRAFAETGQRIHSSNEDLLTALLRFEANIVGTLNINWLSPTKIRELTITGEAGMLRVDYLTQDLVLFENSEANAEWESLRNLRGVSEGRMIRHLVQKREPLVAELTAFVGSVKSGDPSGTVSGEDGLWALDWAQQLIRSATEGVVVGKPSG